jgi:hypothetical protein
MNTAHRITPAAAVEAPQAPVKAAAPAHSEGARVGRNTAFRAAAQAVSALINVGAMVLLGNRLSAAGYGEYAYWYALIPLISRWFGGPRTRRARSATACCSGRWSPRSCSPSASPAA